MKKNLIKIGGQLTRSERKQLAKMRTTARKSGGLSIILFALYLTTIKGKLGFGLKSRDGNFLFDSTAIYQALLDNVGGYYTPPFSGMTALNTANTAFSDAIADVRNGVRGAEGAKVAAKQAVKVLLDAALGYVNNLAANDQTNAVEIITGARMIVTTPIRQDKQELSVKQGNSSGEIMLCALAAKSPAGKYVKASYSWQFSIDNGTTWENLENTVVANTTAVGMLPGIATQFRKRVKTSQGGLSPWSNAVVIYPQ